MRAQIYMRKVYKYIQTTNSESSVTYSYKKFLIFC